MINIQRARHDYPVNGYFIQVEFNVTFEGVPAPKISWYKDGLEIFSNRCQKISTEGNISTFLIYEAAIIDESEIKCSATNRVGYAVTKAYLKVEGIQLL